MIISVYQVSSHKKFVNIVKITLIFRENYHPQNIEDKVSHFTPKLCDCTIYRNYAK